MSGRAERYRHLDAEEKADLALAELDMIEERFDAAIEKLDRTMGKIADRFDNQMTKLRNTLTHILITIVTGMVVALGAWLWTNAGT